MKLRTVAVLALAVSAYGIYIAAALRSPLFDDNERERLAFLGSKKQAAGVPFTDQQRREAEAYYRRFPGLDKDAFFGRNGPMGVRGAVEHYRRHGRHEGRVWGDDEKK